MMLRVTTHRARPNIVYFHTHDTGRMIDPYGWGLGTPRLSAFAREGVVFRQAFAAAPTCSPSRAALLTGQAAHSAGMLGLAHRGFRVTDPTRHIATTLGGVGYATALVGIQHLAPPDEEAALFGYDERLPERDRRAEAVVDSAVDYLARAHDRPFFLSVGLLETHTVSPETSQHLFGYAPVDDRYLPPPPTMPDTPETRADVASFTAALHVVDDALGRLLDALDEHDLADQTIVVVTTDHGPPFPGMKGTLGDAGTGVMLMMRGPGLPAGRVCDALVSQIGLYPTLCELVGIERPEWLQGTSLLPAMLDDVEVNDAVYAEVSHHAAYEPKRSIRTRRWRYARRFGDDLLPVLPNVDASRSKELLIEAGWARHPHDAVELYDLVLDPAERVNLAGKPEYEGVERDLAARLAAWMERTDDPLRRGPVPEASAV
jgi:N-sulfoglucosamine sulfohydrolase